MRIFYLQTDNSKIRIACPKARTITNTCQPLFETLVRSNMTEKMLIFPLSYAVEANAYWKQKTKEYVTFLGEKVIAIKTSECLE